jgi:hypothetical protein
VGSKVTGCLGASALVLAAVASGRGDDQAAPARAAPPPVITSTPAPAGLPASPSGAAVRPCQIPNDLLDKPYERFVDVLVLGEAWDYHDAAWLTDVGFQLVEGERVLLRPHKALDAGKILVLAAHVAADRKDQATLARLTRFVESHKDQRLAAALREVHPIATEAPSEADRLGETLEDITPHTLGLHQAAIRKIRALRLAGDSKKLDEFDRELDRIPALHAGQQAHLDQEIAWARSHMAKDSSLRETIEFLDRLGTLVPCTKID